MSSRILLAAAVMAVLSGCAEPTVAPVSGVVTVDGEPAADVLIQFSSAIEGPDRGPRAQGYTDANGRFELKTTSGQAMPGAAVGPNTVSIYGAESIRSFSQWQPSTDDDGVEQPPVFTPPTIEVPRDSQPLKFDVPPGGTKEANFEF